ncbi:MAG: hypothetical protein IRZ16_13405 [Myxococcaceae bacterium]|nr:hypothetical protein [Myxococcaceae bacterium]
MGGGWARVAIAIGCTFTLACATTNATRAAGIRREAEARLARCLGWDRPAPATPLQRQRCAEESAAFCEQQGLEKTCGASGLWTWAPPSPR